MPTLAASLEGLIVFVVILALSALSNWIKQRKGRTADTWPEADESAPPPVRPDSPRPAPREPEPAFDLERELRRIFGEPDDKPAPPVVVPPLSRESAPPPVVTPPPPPRVEPAMSRESVPEPIALPRGTHFPGSAPSLDEQAPPSFDLATMEESSQAYARGSAVDAAAVAKLEAARMRTEQARPVQVSRRTGGTSAEAEPVLAMLRNPRSARQAILAAVVLGPPKALEA